MRTGTLAGLTARRASGEETSDRDRFDEGEHAEASSDIAGRRIGCESVVRFSRLVVFSAGNAKRVSRLGTRRGLERRFVGVASWRWRRSAKGRTQRATESSMSLILGSGTGESLLVRRPSSGPRAPTTPTAHAAPRALPGPIRTRRP